MTVGGTWLDWETDGRDWPHHAASRFVEAAGIRWHVQDMGPQDAPVILFLHGTGASNHSWRHVLPLLSSTHRTIAIDLPCHAFSRPLSVTDLSLPGMTLSIERLLVALDLFPAGIVGHSAGAAIAMSLAARRAASTAPLVVAVNGAFQPIRGDRLFSPLAKALFANPFSATMFSFAARGSWLGGNLLTATGSPIDAAGAALYRRLISSSGHVRGALGMMAAWNLSTFDRLCGSLGRPPVLVAAKDDPMVPYANSRHVAGIAKGASLVLADRGGHLLHECEPEFVARQIADALASADKGRMDAA